MRTPVLLSLLPTLAFAGTVTVTNPGDLARPAETVEIPATRLKALAGNDDPAALVVRDVATGRILDTQSFDADGDGKPDFLLFQTALAPKESREISVEARKAGEQTSAPVSKAHARFVPERCDDFAWENDRIAHRVYGPALGEKPPRGEYSQISGVDVWLKSTPRLVVDARYKGKDYHRDHGDGLDCYSVGRGRGCGGDAILAGGKWYPAGNYTAWKLLADGPIRASFELTYAFDVAGRKVTQKKRFSLDAGSDFTRVTSVFTAADAAPVRVGTGLTRGDWKGRSGHSEVPFVLAAKPDTGNAPAASGPGFVADWQKNSGKDLGETGAAIVVPGATYEPGEGHWFLVREANPGAPLEAYLGACWSKGGHYATKDAWVKAVETFAKAQAEPVLVSYGR